MRLAMRLQAHRFMSTSCFMCKRPLLLSAVRTSCIKNGIGLALHHILKFQFQFNYAICAKYGVPGNPRLTS